MKNRIKYAAIAACIAVALPAVVSADSRDVNDMVYTLSNNPEQNEVLVFERYSNGHMEAAGSYPTGGVGTGAGLGNQGALALSDNKRYLFAVNAGSNDLSVFRIERDGLRLVDRVAEKGLTPVSVTASHDRVYVVNSGDDSIFGYEFNHRTGKLKALPKSYRKLSADGSSPAQISFDRDAETLVVTEKATNKITSFSLNDDGIPRQRHVIDSAGVTPFGFSFGKRDRFFVSEAQAGAVNGATVSAYTLRHDGTAQLIDGAIAVGQTAACWLVTTPNGKLAFTADTPASAISAFAIDRSGHLSLLNSKAAEEIRPTDLAMAPDGSVLYTLSGGDQSIGIYRVNKAGALNKLDSFDNLPAGVTGLVVR
ncbi:MAG: beta-propeller fold lactonase family protein [Methylomonas sp.]|uniref:lactonase family protein n=1 Tax=Methylomonas sp. TaxID=418 RepID=UPI0025F3575D|nr:beta-propeller fold lactonase family protein [Methylomonas sp.]MCK9605462.1 beta-propeller fold lactonase family protein [Methylomonas sp.]